MSDIFFGAEVDQQLIDLDADNETLYGSGVDTQGYQGVAFFAIVSRGIAATFTLKAQQDTDAAYGSAADLANTGVSIVPGPSADGFAFLVIGNAQERYVRPALVCPDVATVRSAALFSIRYGAKYQPVTNSDGEFFNAPSEGTA